MHQVLDQHLQRQEILVRNFIGAGPGPAAVTPATSSSGGHGREARRLGDAPNEEASRPRHSSASLEERGPVSRSFSIPASAAPATPSQRGARPAPRSGNIDELGPMASANRPSPLSTSASRVNDVVSQMMSNSSSASYGRAARTSVTSNEGEGEPKLMRRSTISGSEAFRNYRQVKSWEVKRAKNLASKFSANVAGLEAIAPGLFRALEWWSALEEPERHGRFSRLVLHSNFDTAISIIILINTIYTSYESNYEMDSLGGSPPFRSEIEWIFLSVYSAELIAKIAVHRLYFFCNSEMTWNWFDFTLVLFSACDMFLVYFGASLGNVTFARSLRLFKLGKIFRIFRTMRFLKELRVMLASIVGSFLSLFWSVTMISMILYVFSLLFLQQMTLQLIVTADQSDTFTWQQQRIFFRNVERTMLTLLETTMGGLDWDTIYLLIEPLGQLYVFAFIFYITFFNFAVLNILTGIFVENAMKLCQPDQEEKEAEALRVRQRDMDELTMLVQAMDADRSGAIKKEEFLDIASQPEVGRVFARLGIDIKDPEVLFHAIANHMHTTEVPIPEFVTRAISFKGQASSLDLYGLIRQTASLHQNVQDVRKRSDQAAHNISNLRGLIHDSLSDLGGRIVDHDGQDLEVLGQLDEIRGRLSTLEGLTDLLGGIRDVLASQSFSDSNEAAFAESATMRVKSPTSRL